jgi:hypothetical protein
MLMSHRVGQKVGQQQKQCERCAAAGGKGYRTLKWE